MVWGRNQDMESRHANQDTGTGLDWRALIRALIQSRHGQSRHVLIRALIRKRALIAFVLNQGTPNQDTNQDTIKACLDSCLDSNQGTGINARNEGRMKARSRHALIGVP